jgi:hypothetical protein
MDRVGLDGHSGRAEERGRPGETKLSWDARSPVTSGLSYDASYQPQLTCTLHPNYPRDGGEAGAYRY